MSETPISARTNRLAQAANWVFQEGESGRFLRRVDWAAFAVCLLVTLAVYGGTLAPTVTLEDSGELAVASDYLGVPHPPGYPIWTLITWFFQWVFHWVSYNGHPNPAWSVGLMSAVFGAITCGIAALLISRSAMAMLRGIPRINQVLEERAESLVCFAAGVTGGLLLAFSHGLWSQSVIVEVYSFNTFFLMIIMMMGYRWLSRPQDTVFLVVLAFLFGLGLTNHQTLMFVGLALAAAILFRDVKLARDFATVVFPLLAVVAYNLLIKEGIEVALQPAPGQPGADPNGVPETVSLLKPFLLLGAGAGLTLLYYREGMYRGALFGLLPMLVVGAAALWLRGLPIGEETGRRLTHLLWKSGPVWTDLRTNTVHSNASFWIQNAVVVLTPVAALFLLQRGRVVGTTYLCTLLGVSFYFYLPFASEQNPPMNWAYPRTWEGLLHSITRGQYERVTLSNIFGDPQRFIAQLGAYFQDLRSQFSLPIALVGVLPFTAWSVQAGRKRIRLFTIGCVLSALVLVPAMLLKILLWTHPGLPPALVRIFSTAYKGMAMGLLLVAVLGILVTVYQYVREELERGGLARILTWTLLGGGACLLLFLDYNLLKFFFMEGVTGRDRALFTVMILLPPALLGLTWWMVHGPAGMQSDLDKLSRRWFLVTIAAFLTLSVVLVIFLNPKLDIQTLFIQRVQLIQSHAVFALWIGYGLALSLALMETHFGKRQPVRWAGIALVLALPLVSLALNAFDSERLRIVGGAEQNGHDFGWQFGYYQLQGAEGIREELEEGEQLPDPDYPPAMTQHAIFYGGTDPGRFVPTYMIYSAKVRPDVFLITQNALADNTYMNVMRDLYGDQIWIPALIDSNNAFSQYVSDVQSGRINAGADVDVRGGRVSVQGVQGVMAINGILAKDIFEHNKALHDFYVEESYVIQWMYPYLQPHGLILKLNKEPIQITEDIAAKDRRFWDWYTERLMSNRAFLRDAVARKTFSKLRGASAGIYTYRRMFEEAEHAFKQSIRLYPMSPEATFRLADVYLQQRRYDDGVALVQNLLDADPLNEKVQSFLAQVKNYRDTDARRVALEKEFEAGSNNLDAAMELSTLYLQLGLGREFQGFTMHLLNEPQLPAERILDLYPLYKQARRQDLMEFALNRYLQREPGNVKIWVELSAVQVQRNRQAEALKTLERAVQMGGEAVRQVIRKDPRFKPMLGDPAFQRLVPRAPQAQAPSPARPTGGTPPTSLQHMQIPSL